MKPTRLEYYEDLYGEANPDEEFDRFPDDCEEESSSSEGESTTTNNNRESEKKQEGFFARFRKRKPEQSASDLVESRVFGKGKRSEGESRVMKVQSESELTDPFHLQIRESATHPPTSSPLRGNAHPSAKS